MGKKSKYTSEQKVQACEDYLIGRKSCSQIAQELGMPKNGDSTVLKWANRYKNNGVAIFMPRAHNQSYSGEFKRQVVQEYLDGKGSIENLTIKYGVPSRTTVHSWIIKYTEGEEIRDYDPQPEVYLATPRKTTFEERLEIVKHCIDNGKNYKKTASEYNCSYSQVRNWVLKYEEDGEEAFRTAEACIRRMKSWTKYSA